jgi:HSP20 family protein
MSTRHPGPASPLEELREELDRFWTSFNVSPSLSGWVSRYPAPRGGLVGGGLAAAPRGGFPLVNVAESDDAITVEAELPGLDVGSIDVSVTDEELVIKRVGPDVVEAGGTTAGERGPQTGSTSAPTATVTWHRRERNDAAFERRIALPVAVDAARVEARLVDGILTVTCPKSPQSQPHKVEVRSA